ncbi:acyl-CoA reductase [soil metagenome]
MTRPPDIAAYHLPDTTRARELIVIAEHDGVRALAPALTATDIGAICRSLTNAQLQLTRMPVDRVIRAVDEAARRLLDPAEPMRHQALAGITAITGYAPAMAALVLDRMAADWTAEPLRELVEAELGGAAAIESFVRTATGTRARAVAPALGIHVLAGNVPGVGVTSVVRALLVRSAVLAKSAVGEPVLTPVFARLLADADADVGACVAATWWAGGDCDIEEAVLEHAGMVIHYGSADAIASLSDRAGTGVRFGEHVPRISCAICRPVSGGDYEAAAADVARAVAIFDQQGCVSPQIVYVIGSSDDARTFAARGAAALERIQPELPRGRISDAEAAAIRDLRTSAEFGAYGGRTTDLWQGDDMSFTVVLSDDSRFEGTCLNRSLLVKPAASVHEVIEAARPFGRLLQTVGLAGFATTDRDDVAIRLTAIGATRITSIAAMPWPPVTWQHDGRGPLTELVRWTTLEG